VRHYFGDKSALFAAAIELPANPEALLAQVAASPAADLGKALATVFFSVWDTPEGHQRLRAIVTTAPADPPTMRALAEFIGHSVLGTVAARLGTPDAAARATLAGTQLVGVMIGRALIGIDPLASMPRDHLITWLAPGLTLLLTGPAPELPTDRGPDPRPPDRPATDPDRPPPDRALHHPAGASTDPHHAPLRGAALRAALPDALAQTPPSAQ
jgi:AcrR family transcriptional regulator